MGWKIPIRSSSVNCWNIPPITGSGPAKECPCRGLDGESCFVVPGHVKLARRLLCEGEQVKGHLVEISDRQESLVRKLVRSKGSPSGEGHTHRSVEMHFGGYPDRRIAPLASCDL